MELCLTEKKGKLFIATFVLSLCLVKYTVFTFKVQHDFNSIIFLSVVLSIPIFIFLFFMLKEIHFTDIIFGGIVLITCFFYHWAIKTPAIAFDTWQVYDMSRYIFEDFGYMSMIRQHIVNSHYEMAFPPIFPVLLGIINCILDMGIMSVILLNYLFCLILIALFKSIGDCLEQRFAFAVSLFMFVVTPLFWGIFRGGLTQLLGFVFFAGIVRLLVKRNFSERDNYLTVLVAGVGLMNRFDFIAITGIIVALTPLKVNVFSDGREGKIKVKNRIIWLFVNLAIVIVVCLPWISYSLAKFGKVFVTDNGRRLVNIVDTRPSTYFSSEVPALTIFDDFDTWMIAFRERMDSSIETLSILMSNYYVFKHFGIVILCVLAIVLFYFLIKERICFAKNVWLPMKKHFEIIIVAASVICYEVTIICTGYNDSRYHILFLFFINISLIILFKMLLQYSCQRLKTQYRYKKIMAGILSLVCSILLIYDGYGMLRDNLSKILIQRTVGEESIAIATMLSEQEKEIDDYLYQQNASCIVINRSESTISVPRTSSLIHTAAILSPSNIAIDNAAFFVRDFNIDYLFSSDPELKDIFASAVGITETSVEHLYKLGVK